jgi:hypothetical protein
VYAFKINNDKYIEMLSFTPNYGAIREIIDERTTYAMKDSTDTEFVFEMCPLHISSEEIDNFFIDNKLTNIWFIDAKISFKPPTESDIEKALNDGLIIKINFTVAILDNYGYLHSITYNEKDKKYNINLNKSVFYGKNSSEELEPYSDDLIDIIKAYSYPKLFAGISANNRFLFGYLFNELNKSYELIKKLEEKINILEQK